MATSIEKTDQHQDCISLLLPVFLSFPCLTSGRTLLCFDINTERLSL